MDVDGCHACPLRCKRVVEASTPYSIDRRFGGPEYETVAAFGSNCGIADLAAVCKANELCAAYGLDTLNRQCDCLRHGMRRERPAGKR